MWVVFVRVVLVIVVVAVVVVVDDVLTLHPTQYWYRHLPVQAVFSAHFL